MSHTLCAPDAPQSSRSLLSVALATGAAVVAGAVLGRRGLPGIAAGLAAFAGAKFLKATRCPAPVKEWDDTAPEIDLSPEPEAPETRKGEDWIDHHAVDFSHDVPDPVEAREMLKEKVLPLLDDDGSPVHNAAEKSIDVVAESVTSEPSDHDLPAGPLIWEPANGAQSRSEGVCETVWFGLQEVIVIGGQERVPVAPQEQATPEAPPQDTEVPSNVPPPLHPQQNAMGESKVPPDAIIPPAGFLPKRRAAPFSVPVKTATAPLPTELSSWTLRADEEDATGPSLADLGDPAPEAANHSSPVPFITSAAVASASVISPKPAKSLLPQPRNQGKLPKHLAGKTPAGKAPAAHLPSSPEAISASTRAWLREFPGLPETVRAEAAVPLRKQLEPIAPMSTLQPAQRRWPLLVLLTLLLAAFLFLAADGWQHGELLRNIKEMSWFRKDAVVKEALTSPAAGHAASAGPTKPISWMRTISQ